MDDKKAEIIAKIEKILVHAKDTEGTPEGDMFRKKAAMMMTKHRILETEIDLEESNIIKDTFEFHVDGKDVPQWVQTLVSGFSWCFDVRPLSCFYSWESPARREWEFIGTFSDVETVAYFVEVVVNHVEEAGWDAWPMERNWRKRNQLGNVAAQVIWQRIYNLKNDMDVTLHEDSDCTALVISKKEMVADAVKAAYPKLSKSKNKKIDMPDDSATIKAGIIAGESAPINFAINEK